MIRKSCPFLLYLIEPDAYRCQFSFLVTVVFWFKRTFHCYTNVISLITV